MAEVSAGNLKVSVKADTADFKRDMSGAEKAVRSLGTEVGKNAKQFALIGAAAAAAGAAIFAGLVKSGLAAVDAQAKLARQLDGSIGGLKALRLAGEDAGVASETLERALDRLNRRLGEAQRGYGEGAKALERLGLSARTLAGLDIDERMAVIADRVKALGLNGAQTADVLGQLGIRQGQLTNLMRQGGDAIRAARQEIRDYGLDISRLDAAKVEAANDAMSRAGLVVDSVRSQLAIGLAPVLLEVANRFNSAARQAGGWGDQAKTAAEIAIRMAGRFAMALGDTIHFLEQHPVVGKAGILGFALFGSKGVAIIAGAALAYEKASDAIERGTRKRTALQQGEVSAIDEVIARHKRELEIRAKAGNDPVNLRIIETRKKQIAALEAQREETLKAREAEDAYTTGLRAIGKHQDEVSAKTGSLGLAIKNLGKTFADFKAPDIKLPDVLKPGDPGAAGGGQDKAAAARLEQLRKQYEARLQLVREFLMTEEQVELEHERLAQERRMTDLRNALNAQLVTREEFARLTEAATLKHQQNMTKIQRDAEQKRKALALTAWNQQAEGLSQALGLMTQAIGSETKTQFNIQKAFAIAQAIVNTYQGITKTLATYPWPIAGILAAAHGAFGFAQVARIASQQFNGGGSGGGGGGGGRAVAASSAGAVGSSAAASSGDQGGDRLPQNVIVNLRGGQSRYTREEINQIITGINDALGDGVRLRVM